MRPVGITEATFCTSLTVLLRITTPNATLVRYSPLSNSLGQRSREGESLLRASLPLKI